MALDFFRLAILGMRSFNLTLARYHGFANWAEGEQVVD